MLLDAFLYLKNSKLSDLFAENPLRSELLHIQAPYLSLDFSHQPIDPQAIKLFAASSHPIALNQQIQKLMQGEPINYSESRPALHTALRSFNSTAHFQADILKSHEQMAVLAQELREWGCEHAVVLGIGGSYWGPLCVYEALKTGKEAISLHFLADIEQAAFDRTFSSLPPEKTAVIVISKSFHSVETLNNARRAVQWLGDRFPKQCIAITANTQAAIEFGIMPAHILPLWDWVGGRYSIWGTPGFTLWLSLGEQRFKAFLQGAYEMDQHTLHSAAHQNAPMMSAFISYLNQQFFDARTEVLIPYSFRLHALVPYLQQLFMESLGKNCNHHGQPLAGSSGPIVWGTTGLHAQHTFNQLLHQGTHCAPIDFIVPLDEPDLVAACMAQSHALTHGDQQTENPHARLPGNRPHHIIRYERLLPETLGALLAFYEHKVYLLSCFLNVNPFDQFGVELAKRNMEGS